MTVESFVCWWNSNHGSHKLITKLMLAKIDQAYDSFLFLVPSKSFYPISKAEVVVMKLHEVRHELGPTKKRMSTEVLMVLLTVSKSLEYRITAKNSVQWFSIPQISSLCAFSRNRKSVKNIIPKKLKMTSPSIYDVSVEASSVLLFHPALLDDMIIYLAKETLPQTCHKLRLIIPCVTNETVPKCPDTEQRQYNPCVKKADTIQASWILRSTPCLSTQWETSVHLLMWILRSTPAT